MINCQSFKLLKYLKWFANISPRLKEAICKIIWPLAPSQLSDGSERMSFMTFPYYRCEGREEQEVLIDSNVCAGGPASKPEAGKLREVAWSRFLLQLSGVSHEAKHVFPGCPISWISHRAPWNYTRYATTLTDSGIWPTLLQGSSIFSFYHMLKVIRHKVVLPCKKEFMSECEVSQCSSEPSSEHVNRWSGFVGWKWTSHTVHETKKSLSEA